MKIQEGNIEDWKKAGQIAKDALEYGATLIKPGAKAVDVLDAIEEKIHELGGEIAFPAQLSCDSIAAHWCADPEDPLTFKDEIVCLDVGVHVNGCIGDNATTVDLSGKYENLVKAPRAALNEAIKIIKPGVTLGEIGKVIKETIESYGFTPIHNLSGHGLDQFKVHCDPQVPNYDTKETEQLPVGKIIAIEPFATNGAGMIQEGGQANLFSFSRKRPVRSPFAREVLKEIENLQGLPFTTRWLTKKIPKAKVLFGLRELLSSGVIRDYPPLVETGKGDVSQAEHTVLITEDGCEVLTKGNL